MIAAQPNTLIGVRNRALISLGYDFLARRSELTGLMQGDFEFTDAGGLRGVIRRSKTDQFGEGRLVYGSKRSHDLLRNHNGKKVSPRSRPALEYLKHHKQSLDSIV